MIAILAITVCLAATVALVLVYAAKVRRLRAQVRRMQRLALAHVLREPVDCVLTRTERRQWRHIVAYNATGQGWIDHPNAPTT